MTLTKINKKWCETALKKAKAIYKNINLNGIAKSKPEYDFDLNCPFVQTQILKAKNFLSHQQKRKTINLDRTSYGLKHIAEKWKDPQFPDCSYISNGAFIVAAIGLGFETKQVTNFNACINISSKGITQILKERGTLC